MKKGKKLVSIILGVALTLQPFGGIEPAKAADEVEINAANFPDEKFRSYVETNFDTDENQVLSVEEIAAVTAIDISDEKVVCDMTGVEVFTELQMLNCSKQALPVLDITELQNLKSLQANDSRIQTLMLPRKASGLIHIDVSSNKITDLSVISNYGQLQLLDVSGNQLVELDVSQLKELTSLNVSSNALKSLDLSANSKLQILMCSSMKSMTALDVATTDTVDHRSLTMLNCTGSSLDTLDVSGDSGLEVLDASDNAIVNFDMSGATALKNLDLRKNKLTQLDVTEQTELMTLDASENSAIESVDVTKNTQLQVLALSALALRSMDVTKNTELVSLNLSKNQMSTIDISNNIKLSTLNLSDNQLLNINLENNTALTELNLSNNRLVALDASKCSKLTDDQLICKGNKREISLNEPNFDFDLSTLAKDGFVAEISGLNRGDETVGNACVEITENTVKGGEISAYDLVPDVDSTEVTYNYYYGLGKRKVPFTLKITNPLTMTIWYEANGTVHDSDKKMKMRVGEETTLTARDNEKNLLQNITWSSGDKNVIDIDEQTGKVICKSAGTAKVYVSINHKVRCFIEFECHNPVTSIQLQDTAGNVYSEGGIIELETGEKVDNSKRTKNLKALCYDNTGTLVADDYAGVTYSVTDAEGKATKNVITCSSSGVVTAQGSGTAFLHCVSKDSGVETVIQFNVTRRVDRIQLSPSSDFSMFVGDQKQIVASTEPNTANNQKVYWQSSNEDIAVVDENGVVTAKAPTEGDNTVKITCISDDDPSVYAVVCITVTPAAAGVTLDHTEYELALGGAASDKMIQLEATIEADDGIVYTKTWTSSNSEVASVSAQGMVTAKKPGEAVIKCAVSDTKYATCKITVVQRVTGISAIVDTDAKTISSPYNLNVNQTRQIVAKIAPKNATNPKVTWTSSDESVATISADGVIQTLKKGETTITCKATDGSEKTKSFLLRVKLPVAQLVVDKDAVVVYVKKNQKVTATVLPQDASNGALLWESENPTIATVSNSGNITGVSAGTTTVKCTTKDGTNLTKEIQVTVLQQISNIDLDQTKVDMIVGKTLTLKATIEPETVTNAGLVWSSNNEAVATVDQNGVVTAVGRGTARITCAALDGLGAKATCDVTVTQLVSKITLSSNTMTVGVGKTSRLTATIEPATASNRTVEWTSSNENVATVTSTGYVKGVAKGSAVITCKAKDASGVVTTCTVTVIEPITGVKLNVANKTLLVGKKVTLKATITPGTVDRKYITWTTSNAKVATVTAGGVVKAVGRGTATISCVAQDGSGIKANCQITVKQPVKKVKLNKKTLKLKLKKSYKLKATVTPKNADNKAVKWKTSNKKVVTVTQSGKITAKKKGTATITITAKDGSKKKATCKVRVY